MAKKKYDDNKNHRSIKVVLCDVDKIQESQIKDKSKEVLNINIKSIKIVLKEAMYKCCLACNKSSDMWKEHYFSLREESLAEFNSISDEDKEKIIKDEFEKAKKRVKKDKLDNENYMKAVYDNTKKRTLEKMLSDIESRIISERKGRDGKEFKNVVQGVTKLIMKDYTASNVGCLDQLLVQANWNRDKEKILSYEARVPQYKKDTPYCFHNNNYNIEIDKRGNYYISITIYSEDYCMKNNLKAKGFRYRFKVDKINDSQKAILNRMINGEYKQGSAHISISNKDKIEFTMSFSFENANTIMLNPNRTLGIDLGIVNVATMSIYDKDTESYDWVNYKSNIMSGKELINFRQMCYNKEMSNYEIEKEIKKHNDKILQRQLNKFNLGIIDGIEVTNMRSTHEKRKNELNIASKWSSEGSNGHGRKAKTKNINKLRDKIARFSDTFNHKYSKYIVEFAVKNNCGVIQMEDLSGATKDTTDKFLKDWSYHDLQFKIEYKAKEYGIEVIKVNPKFTSKRCNRCGCIHKENRDGSKNQAKFECVVCGHKDNADVNASKNIALSNITEIIKKTPKQGYKKED